MSDPKKYHGGCTHCDLVPGPQDVDVRMHHAYVQGSCGQCHRFILIIPGHNPTFSPAVFDYPNEAHIPDEG